MAIDPVSFKLRFPEFDSVDDVRVQLFIDDSIVILNEPYWGEKYNLGLNYLTAHYLALGSKTEAGSTASSSIVSGKAVDGVSISYATPPIDDGTDAYYSSTQYGQRYLALRKTLGVPAHVI